MRINQLQVRDFRNYERAEVAFSPTLTVVWGENGAGKTSLLEALYFGCVGSSCLGARERELVRFGKQVARAQVNIEVEYGVHTLSTAYQHNVGKRIAIDGVQTQRLIAGEQRPLISVFLPDRLELVKGPPALRRSHLDRFVLALWPTRTTIRSAYGQTLAQRNALLSHIRHGRHTAREQLSAWDSRLASCALELIAARIEAVDRLKELFSTRCEQLGLRGAVELNYRSSAKDISEDEFIFELQARLEHDLQRGYTGYGPHRDELALQRDGRALRTYGSQGEQRLALLALLLSERTALHVQRGVMPLLLLDDVMSELDLTRRRRLVELLQDGGQSVITTTETEHVPVDGADSLAEWVKVESGMVTPTLVAV